MQAQKGVQRGVQWRPVPLDLGQQQSALQAGQPGHRQGIRVEAGPELPGGVQLPQSVAQRVRPPVEPFCDLGAGLGVGLGQLTAE